MTSIPWWHYGGLCHQATLSFDRTESIIEIGYEPNVLLSIRLVNVKTDFKDELCKFARVNASNFGAFMSSRWSDGNEKSCRKTTALNLFSPKNQQFRKVVFFRSTIIRRLFSLLFDARKNPSRGHLLWLFPQFLNRVLIWSFEFSMFENGFSSVRETIKNILLGENEENLWNGESANTLFS